MMTPIRFSVLAALGASLAGAAPVIAHAPLEFTEESTAIVCEEVFGEGGVIRLAAGLLSPGGPVGDLRYWDSDSEPGLDEPTLTDANNVTVTLVDGVITATFDMFTPEVEEGPEPVFVGVAELTASVEA